ncbi:MAG: MFS transporter [Bosea sp. (in: a-proteobacteria)]
MTTPAASTGMNRATWQALIVLSFTMIVAWGSLYYGMTMLGTRIRAETGWSQGLVYGGFSLGMIVSGIAATPVGRAIDQRGGRGVMALGSVIGGLGYLLMAYSYHPATYLAAWVLIGLGMAGSLYDPAFATLTRYAGQNARKAISTLTLAGGLASTVFWPLGLWLLQHFDWRGVALIYAAMNAVLCAGLHRLALPPDPGSSTIATASAASSDDAPAPLPVSTRKVVLICLTLALMMHGLITNAMSVHLIATLDSLGLSEAQAVAAGALIGPAQSAARFIEMLFGGRYPVLALGLISTGLMPLAFGILFLGQFGLTWVIIFALVYGASNGLLTIARGIIPLGLFGREGYGATLGMISGPALAVKSLAPLLFALLLAAIGSAWAMGVLAGLAIAAFAAMIVLVMAVQRARAG